MSAEKTSIELFGESFPVLWHSQRRFANRKTCYVMLSFACRKPNDDDALLTGLPASIEERYLPNPGYEADEWAEGLRQAVAEVKGMSPTPETREPGAPYIPPEAQGLKIIDLPYELGTSGIFERRAPLHDQLIPILKEAFGVIVTGGPMEPWEPESDAPHRRTPGTVIFEATFPDGRVVLLKDVTECSMPSEALDHFHLANEQDQPAARNVKHSHGRLSWLSDFTTVWLDSTEYGLSRRKRAQDCIKYLVQSNAWDAAHALHKDDIEHEVTGHGPPYIDVNIKKYFQPTSKGKSLRELCGIIKPVAKTGKYYLEVRKRKTTRI